jgi:hypothetical protein
LSTPGASALADVPAKLICAAAIAAGSMVGILGLLAMWRPSLVDARAACVVDESEGRLSKLFCGLLRRLSALLCGLLGALPCGGLRDDSTGGFFCDFLCGLLCWIVMVAIMEHKNSRYRNE